MYIEDGKVKYSNEGDGSLLIEYYEVIDKGTIMLTFPVVMDMLVHVWVLNILKIKKVKNLQLEYKKLI